MYYIANFKKSKLFDIRMTFFVFRMQFDMSDVLSCPTKNTVETLKTLIPDPLRDRESKIWDYLVKFEM